jgi:hypothetical protein
MVRILDYLILERKEEEEGGNELFLILIYSCFLFLKPIIAYVPLACGNHYEEQE